MSQHSRRHSQNKSSLRIFENNGFVYGLGLGAVIGVVVAGPHFREWSLFTSFGTIFGWGVGIGILGYFAIAIAFGSASGGFGGASDIGDDNSLNDGMDGGSGDGGGND
jgi:hypothetical protein